MPLSNKYNYGAQSATAIQHPLVTDDPLRGGGGRANANAARTRLSSSVSSDRLTTPRRRGRRGSGDTGKNSNQCVMSIARSGSSRQQEKLPRSVRWRLSLDLLTRPATDSGDNEKDILLKSIEDLNALKLRFQRSRYDELEKKHYWKSTPMGIADETNQSRGTENAAGNTQQMESLHHVAPGDDPLSGLLQDKNNPPKNSNASKSKVDDKKGKLFGGNGIFGNRARTKSKDSLLSTSFTSMGSSSDGEADACKGSRWAEFYSTREVLGVIEKDLDRLPTDHYTIFHEWRLKDQGWKEHRLKEEEWKRRQEEKEDDLDESKRSQDSAQPAPAQQLDEISVESQPVDFNKSWSLGQSWNMGGLKKKVKSMENLSMLLEANDSYDEEEEAEQLRQQEEKAKIKLSQKERAEKLSQILFVYAKEHPEIGYRQGMHEILSYVLLALEMDLLERAIILERKRWRKNSLTFSQPNNVAEAEVDGSPAGVDSSGKIVVVRLLDSDYMLHDAFSIFECIMTSLAPAYDAIPAGDEITASVLEEAKAERGESPMELMTSSIVSKIRFVARDEQLYGHVLYMPVPPQLYFAKWIRLMFGREVAGGMKSVLGLWDAFFDLASARTSSSQDEVPVTIALLDVLKAAATSMILLIRHKLLAPTVGYDGSMTGEPDPNVGIGYLMNYPPIEDIGPLLESISDLLAKEKKLSNQYLVSKERKLSKQYLPPESYNMASNAKRPLQTNETGNVSHSQPHQADPLSSQLNRGTNGSGQQNYFSEEVQDELPQVYRPGAVLHQKHEVVESLGNIAGGLLDFGSKTATAALASIHKQYENHRRVSVDHPLQDNGFNANGQSPGNTDQRKGEYVINYRSYAPKSSRETSNNVMQEPIGEGGEFSDEDLTPKKKTVDVVQSPINLGPPLPIEETSQEEDLVEQLIMSAEKDASDDDASSTEKLDDSFSSKLSVSKSVGESIQKSPRELATKLEKSVATLMKHFNDCLSTEADTILGDSSHSMNNGPTSSVIPDDIWDAMADIDLVRKELLSQAAMTDLAKSSTSLRSSGGSVNSKQGNTGRNGRRRGRPSWHL